MDTQTIDQEYTKLEGEFADIAKTVQGLVDKLQAAEQAGDKNAAEWLDDMKVIVQDISDEQTQAKVLLLAIHAFIRNIASAQAEASDGAASSADPSDKPPLYAPGHEPAPEPQQQPQQGSYGRGGMMGGGMMMGGPMMGGYMGGGFARAMEMGAGMSIGASLVNNIFRR